MHFGPIDETAPHELQQATIDNNRTIDEHLLSTVGLDLEMIFDSMHKLQRRRDAAYVEDPMGPASRYM
jgi:hypothetical protein